MDQPDAGYTCPQCDDRVYQVSRSFSADFTRTKQPQPYHLELFLDNTRSVFNVGTMFRTADGAGIKMLHLAGITATPEHPKFEKTALGSDMRWKHYFNGVEAARALKAAGYKLWALEDTLDAVNLFEVRPMTTEDKIVLVCGNEVVGVDPGILELCDKCLMIPMVGEKKSLNVAIACGIAIYKLLHGGSG